MKKTTQRPCLKSGCATTKCFPKCVRSTCAEYRLPERAASSGGDERRRRSIAPPAPRRRLWPLAGGLEFLLELPGQVDEPRREANVLVDRIALIIARNDLRTA